MNPTATTAYTVTLNDKASLQLTTEPPELKGPTSSAPLSFDDRGIAAGDGFTITRTICPVPGGVTLSIRIDNTGSEPISVNRLNLARITHDDLPDFLSDAESIRVLRLPRQKNDLAGCLSLPPRDAAEIEDALFQSAEVAAGAGISWEDFGKDGISLDGDIIADPAVVLSADHTHGTSLLMGVVGQSEHLNDIILSRRGDGSLSDIVFWANFDGITLPPGQSRSTHDLLIAAGDRAASLLKDFAHAVGTYYDHTPHTAAGPGVYCTWYFYGRTFDQADLLENLDSLKQHPIPFDVFQLDDGWMNNYGDWQANTDKFPDGMAAVADRIRAAGMTPGIWTCPFVIEQHAGILKTTPDIILKNRDGEPCYFLFGDQKGFTLDPFAHDAEAYVTAFYQKMRRWGYDYFKLDFLRALLIHDDAVFADPNKNRAQAYRRAMELVRNGVGPDGIIAACGGLFEGTAGLCDINRSGADVKGHWNMTGKRIEAYAPRIKQNITRNFQNRLWHTDPDALQLRRRTALWKNNATIDHLSMGRFTDEEAFSTVVNAFLGGGICCASDRLVQLDDDRRVLYRHVLPQLAPPAAFGPWHTYMPDTFITTIDAPANGLEPYWIITVANFADTGIDRTVRPAELIADLPASLAVFEFRLQSYDGTQSPDDPITVTIPPHAMRVFRLTPVTNDRPALIGTDMNLTMGLELSSWNVTNHTITGTVGTRWTCPVTLTVRQADGLIRRIHTRPGESFTLDIPPKDPQ